METVTIRKNTYKFVPYKITEGTNRVFYANTIQFVNLGTGTVLINDVFELPSGASQSLEGLQNEVDMTSYKIAFVTGFVNKLQVFCKEDMGAASIAEEKLMIGRKPAPNRREQIKQYLNMRTKQYVQNRSEKSKALIIALGLNY